MEFASPDGTREATRLSWLPVVLLALSVLWIACWFVHARGFWDDAAFLHLEFARSLASGHGYRFNGHVVYADDSPLWVWLLAAAHAMAGEWITAGKALTVLIAIFALGGVFELARQLTRELGRAQSGMFSAAMVLLLAVNPAFDRWVFSGMEAVAAAGLACWGLAAIAGRATQALSPRRLLLGCMCAGLAPLLRPDMVIFTALLGLLLFVHWVNMPLLFGQKLRVFFAGLMLVFAPSVAWTVYAVRVFGTAVPNSYAASVDAPHASTLTGLLRDYAVEFPLLLVGVPALCIWFGVGRVRASRVSGEEVASALGAGWLAFAWAALLVLFYLVHHTRVQSRYVLVSAPALTVALLAVVRKLWPRLYRVGLVFGVGLGIGVSLLVSWPAITAETRADRDYASLAAFARLLPAGNAVAANRAGELGFLSQHPVVDMSGLTRPGVLPFRWDATDNRRVWWAHEQGARYLVLDHAPEPGATPVWSRDIPGTVPPLTPEQRGAFDSLILWKLPPSPTLPVPSDMPMEIQ